MVGSLLDPQLRRLIGRFFKLLVPTGPERLWSTDSANLPPAADWQYHQCYVTDKTCVAVSTGSAWVRADGSAL